MADSLTIEQMEHELRENGWKPRKGMSFMWESPEGRLFLGPAGAWRVMKGVSQGSEYTVRTLGSGGTHGR